MSYGNEGKVDSVAQARAPAVAREAPGRCGW